MALPDMDSSTAWLPSWEMIDVLCVGVVTQNSGRPPTLSTEFLKKQSQFQFKKF